MRTPNSPDPDDLPAVLLELAEELTDAADAAVFSSATYSDGLREAADRIRTVIGGQA
jgi:hypothetical protein